MISNNAILLLGSNLGDRLQSLHQAEEQINNAIGKIIKRSKAYETASWGNTGLAPFLNKIIEVETTLQPQETMQRILQIEQSMGRKRSEKWESRILDIDILFWGDEIIRLPDLTIPHPQLHLRRFTLVPLVEIHPSKIHPVFQKTFHQLLDELTDPLTVMEFNGTLSLK